MEMEERNGLYEDAPELEFFSVQDLEGKVFKDYPENWMFAVEIDDKLQENPYCDIDIFFNNFRKRPGAVIQLNWRKERWEIYNSFPHATFNDCLDFFARQIMLESFNLTEYVMTLGNYFNDETDFELLNLNSTIDEEPDEIQRSHANRYVEVVIYSEEERQNLSLTSLYKYVVELMHTAFDGVDKFKANIAESRKKYINRTANLEDITLPYLLRSYKYARTNDEKGKSLEDLLAYFLRQVKGFEIMNRVKTTNEEIDIVIYNDSKESPWIKESQFILIECKNWTKEKVGKNEYTSFVRKLENRGNRANLGFIISTSGFTEGFYTERLRDSKGSTLIVDIKTSNLIECLENGSQSAEELLKEAYIRSSMV